MSGSAAKRFRNHAQISELRFQLGKPSARRDEKAPPPRNIVEGTIVTRPCSSAMNLRPIL
jgi:hypothetical protein